MREYQDLSDFIIEFNPLTHSDERYKRIFEDPYARVILAGFRLTHLMEEKGINTLKDEALSIGEEIRNGETKLEHEALKERLRKMYVRVTPRSVGNVDNDINEDFVNYILSYLKEEKSFGYTIKEA